MTVTWNLPTENGSPITEYKVFIKEIVSGTFTQESVDCVGTNAVVIAQRECTI